jgi:hypothetical protein
MADRLMNNDVASCFFAINQFNIQIIQKCTLLFFNSSIFYLHSSRIDMFIHSIVGNKTHVCFSFSLRRILNGFFVFFEDKQMREKKEYFNRIQKYDD